ncbi:Crp/Fnr family transcriptional regulator [Kitasatospora sp. NPDC056327]|uniref:Crp/Fnr family transcriptional regulator n=1 Tax=Kitasatospora sp. NPDC056327 TaxID=3345785 RepID=UPI0035DF12C9
MSTGVQPSDDGERQGTAPAHWRSSADWPAGTYLSLLPDHAHRALWSVGVRKDYEPHEVLVREGDPSTFLAVILDGLTKVTSMTAEGHVSLLAFRAAGDLVGELGVLDRAPRAATVEAVTAVRARLVPHDTFVNQVRAEPALALALVSAVSEKLRAATRARVDTGGYPLAVRVARTISELAGSYGRTDGEGTVIDFPLSQEDLAAIVSSSAVGVARVLRQFRERGMVRTRYRRLMVTDWDALSELAAAD